MKVGRRKCASVTLRAIYYALASNVTAAACEYVVALLTHAGAALAEAIHSSADCLNQLIMLYGHRRARAQPDEQHSFGFGREGGALRCRRIAAPSAASTATAPLPYDRLTCSSTTARRDRKTMGARRIVHYATRDSPRRWPSI
ncbi:cation transporter [Paraburkholderia sp. LEh10]|uniref:cation transporter n=1 Tax=Paraburkholderia sp. LEh10 TaxID=2821353 RepID=UPI001AEADFA4|nr:cation transporter [Paraburkholderia sp. LEh10]MBP0588187.1 cation transporter [Paraburkholderia sp. LEh10]